MTDPWIADYINGSTSQERTFWRLYNQWSANNRQIRDLRQTLNQPTTVDEAGVPTISIAAVGSQPARQTTPSEVLAQIKYYEDTNETLVDQIYNANPEMGAAYFPEYFDADRAKDLRDLYGGGGAASAGPSYQFQIGGGGEVYRISSAGTIEYVQTIPELANKTTQVMNDARTGESFAVTFDGAGNMTGRTSLGKTGYAEIDPERQFRLEMLSAGAAAESSLNGIELERRGQVVNAIVQDVANQFEFGRMTHDEALLNLNRVNSALEQRRAEREQLFAYGVRQASVRRDSAGNEVTTLPFGRQTASILGQATGREFSEEDFTLDVTRINPEQAGRDVINGSAFTSPLPGLMAAIEGARTAMDATVNSPLGNSAVTETLIAEATAGV